MNGPSVHEEVDEGERDDLGSGLGLRAESRVERRANRRRARGRRAFGCFAGLISLIVVGALVAGAVVGFGKGKDALEGLFSAPDYEGAGTGTVVVEITKGQATASIADTLEKKEVVKSARAFERVARDDPRSLQIQAATYTLRKHMSAKAALDLMLNTAESVKVARISIAAGKTKAEVAVILQGSKMKLPAGAAATALGKPALLGLPPYAHNNAEGFLFPGTYDVPKNANAYTMLKLMTANYAKTAASLDLVNTASRKKLDPYQAVIVASIIGAETNRSEDYAKVARVIYNRLAAGMRLQMDSTIHYVVGKDGGVFTTPEQRENPSRYNTYKYKGLPPTPINSPTRDELRAAINPAQGSWLYFTLVNLDTGETAFASSAEEHQANVKKLQAWCQAHKGRC
ncbi:endolytic transglycosylase MltG [Kribbella speibonae]|uniref:Endolytic murein transglycosylase n=1 Tax=Kribbella speibonae TaxID=1572660 RepID=A0A4R0IAP2_9ACTN|nr:endolytic transglycosylase MltG [Kribbella speibonae]TCC23021.1 endolytic transglycosylase MltG [Kribbella speibonae]TCC30111.1 endolytic transglycosylase MltG [Kribbella speibonae]